MTTLPMGHAMVTESSARSQKNLHKMVLSGRRVLSVIACLAGLARLEGSSAKTHAVGAVGTMKLLGC